MRYIPSSAEPKTLTEGRACLQATPGVGDDWYAHLDADAKKAVREQRLSEQGHLCAYTELRIKPDNCHIEHMFPQSHCSAEESVAYDNLVLCFPGPDQTHAGFGAFEKADWPDRSQRSLFIRPTDPGCEARFLYKNDGQIVPADTNDSAAIETIGKLNLNAAENKSKPQQGYLRRNRKQAIENVLVGMLDIDKVNRRLKVLRNGFNGQLEEFYSAKYQALERLKIKLHAIQTQRSKSRKN